MCGICGIATLDGSPADRGAVLAAREATLHRGPDDAGLWAEGPAALGFRRLSILDLDPRANQPMASADGRLVLVFNGEIYNHPRLKAELEASGARYRTRSDTETILHLFERQGSGAFARLGGMFALALWDRRDRTLWLARDPLGVKPLYYSMHGGRLAFSSELRSLLAAGVPDTLDLDSALEYLTHGRVHAPHTALSHVRKLPPGHLLRLRGGEAAVERFWNLPQPSEARLDPREVEEQALRLVSECVRDQLLSDVPVGAFLSGGVDSSLVAALMARETGRKVPTFTIGFSGARSGLDESAQARLVSRHLGTDHHELILPADVLGRLEELVPSLDEPIADSAVLPTHLLARFARQSVKVVLTGEGADELFAGYNRYKAAVISESLGRLPAWSRGPAAFLARRLGRGRMFEALPLSTVGDWATALAHGGEGELAAVCSPAALAQARPRPSPPSWLGSNGEPLSLGRAQAHDLRTVLCDSLLMKVDKATMRASLEARVPFLDTRLVEFAARLPSSMKVRLFKSKVLLRRLAARLLPRSIAWRRKHGFLVPWEEWVRDPGSRRIDELLDAVPAGGLLDPGRLRSLRRRLVDGDGGADAGLFFRAVVYGLWVDSLRAYKGAAAVPR